MVSDGLDRPDPDRQSPVSDQSPSTASSCPQWEFAAQGCRQLACAISMNGRHEDHILYLPSADPEQEFRLHLDENISSSVARLLRKRGYDVTTTNDVGLRARSDTSHMSYASQQQRIIVTRDRDFLQLHEQDYEHSGIVYWPHNEAVAIGDMQQLLVDLLQRIAESPAQGSGIPAEFNTTSIKKKGKKRKRKGSPRKPPVSNELPAGIEVQGTVQSASGDTLQVQLTTGQTAWLLPQRLGRPTPQVGDEIQAVTVRFVKSRKQLHLSMRRAYTSARTIPHLGYEEAATQRTCPAPRDL